MPVRFYLTAGACSLHDQQKQKARLTIILEVQIEMYSISENGSLSKRAVPLIEDGNKPTPVPLHHVMPVHEFLAPVGSSKDAISAALEGLQAGGYPDAGLGSMHGIRASRERRSSHGYINSIHSTPHVPAVPLWSPGQFQQ